MRAIAEQAAKAVIDANDLNTRYHVRGPLGVRLGMVVTINGKKAIRLMKASPPRPDLLEVTAVDGVPLKSSVTLPYVTLPWSPVELEMNRQYELRAYQDGGFSGIPAEALKETREVQSRLYDFRVHLVVLKSVKPSVPVQHDEGR